MVSWSVTQSGGKTLWKPRSHLVFQVQGHEDQGGGGKSENSEEEKNFLSGAVDNISHAWLFKFKLMKVK